jgi:hypothetical protein
VLVLDVGLLKSLLRKVAIVLGPMVLRSERQCQEKIEKGLVIIC